jgi:hypothetical protein
MMRRANESSGGGQTICPGTEVRTRTWPDAQDLIRSRSADEEDLHRCDQRRDEAALTFLRERDGIAEAEQIRRGIALWLESRDVY